MSRTVFLQRFGCFGKLELAFKDDLTTQVLLDLFLFQESPPEGKPRKIAIFHSQIWFFAQFTREFQNYIALLPMIPSILKN